MIANDLSWINIIIISSITLFILISVAFFIILYSIKNKKHITYLIKINGNSNAADIKLILQYWKLNFFKSEFSDIIIFSENIDNKAEKICETFSKSKNFIYIKIGENLQNY